MMELLWAASISALTVTFIVTLAWLIMCFMAFTMKNHLGKFVLFTIFTLFVSLTAYIHSNTITLNP